MKIVGARFQERADAEHALDELRSCLDIRPTDAAAQALGTTDYAEPAEGTLLAGRFRDERVATVEDIIKQHGGEILFEANEDGLNG